MLLQLSILAGTLFQLLVSLSAKQPAKACDFTKDLLSLNTCPYLAGSFTTKER